MQNTGRLKHPAIKWAMHITGKRISLALKWVISTALKSPYILLNLALKCPAPVGKCIKTFTFLIEVYFKLSELNQFMIVMSHVLSTQSSS